MDLDLYQKFETSPVRNAYFESVHYEDSILRAMLISSVSTAEVNDDIEEFEGIAFEITDDEIKVSKGFKEFVLFNFFGDQ